MNENNFSYEIITIDVDMAQGDDSSAEREIKNAIEQKKLELILNWFKIYDSGFKNKLNILT